MPFPASDSVDEYARCIMCPMPRDLKEPEGWRFSSLRKTLLFDGLDETVGQHAGNVKS